MKTNLPALCVKYASIGSISHGTLRPEDLLQAFSDELEFLLRKQPAAYPDAVALLAEISESQDSEDEDDDIRMDFIERLSDSLEFFAPPYCYFGALEGDGSDFGFWPCMSSIEELDQVEDSDQAIELGEDCYSVNDHGNVTVYGGDGSVILAFV